MRTISLIFTLLLCLGLSFFSQDALAQGEFMNHSTTIAPLGSTIHTPNVNTPSVFKLNTKPTTSSSTIIETNKIQFTKTNDFKNPHDDVKEKLNNSQKEFNPNFVNRDQFFGVFKTKSEYVRVCYRDFSSIDGDVIELHTPDMILVPNAILSMDCQNIKLRLLKGENTITLVALNEGQSPPNTGELQIYDEQGLLLSDNQWGLGAGYSASVTIYKE